MAKVFLGIGTGASVSGGAVDFYLPVGNANFSSSTTEANRAITARTEGTYTELYASVPTNSSDGTFTFKSRKNVADGNLVLAVTASSTGSFSATGTDSMSAGDEYNLKVSNAGSSGSIEIATVGTIFEATTNTVKKFVLAANNAFSTDSATRYVPITGLPSFNATESDSTENMNLTGTFKNLFLFISANARGTTTTYRTRENAGNGNQTVSVTAGSTGIFEDTSNTDPVVATGDFCFSFVTSTGGGNIVLQVLAVDFETTDGSTFHATRDNTLSSEAFGQTFYTTLWGHIPSYLTTETDAQSRHRIAGNLSKLQFRMRTNSLNGASTVRLRSGGGNGNNVVTINASTTGYFLDSSSTDTITDTTLIDYQIVLGGSSGSCVFDSATMNFSGTVVYTIDLDQGAYSLTGQSVIFLYHRIMALVQGAYALTGQSVIFTQSRVMILEFGSYILSGIDVILRFVGWSNQSKNSSSWNDSTKHSSTFSNESKSSSSWNNQSKS